MFHNSADSPVKILSTAASYFRGRLIFGRAILYSDRLEVTAIGRSRAVIRLNLIADVRAESAIGGRNLYLYLPNGETIRLELVRGAALWDLKIKECLGAYAMSEQTREATADDGRDHAPSRNRHAGDRVAQHPSTPSDSSSLIPNGIPESGNSAWAGSGGDSTDHPPVQFSSSSEN